MDPQNLLHLKERLRSYAEEEYVDLYDEILGAAQVLLEEALESEDDEEVDALLEAALTLLEALEGEEGE
ncbi:hypothetical protein MN1_770 [Thermus phage MN1]|nr:hypothetical protein MN1_770 [Thermus phage MN1]